ncbi:acyl-CoA dehydrogenase family protein [Desulfofundulus thermocisternus]|uniref:acyl-CoA dehydrogenase family protein n=1 Tax=Desulfofundulus thermocisternus TaxID=42471 RepID=UPI00217E6B8C|nr:acyl-CoA dehydrogenase family protein [Desulfofundulus thermocisternus]MCS5694709.1 acyl-CoA dehydrogenase family protein [Desulfofundulus thermocisternus]
MEFALSKEQRLLKEKVRAFAEKEILPYRDADEKERLFRPELVRKMGEQGFLGSVIPLEYGGNGLGFLESVIIVEEISRISPSYRAVVTIQNLANALTLNYYGKEAQKQKFIPAWVEGKSISYLAITEPGAGSDIASMESLAKDKGSYFELSGRKSWVAFAPFAEWGLVYAYIDPAARYRGMACFLVNLKEDNGIRVEPIESQMGLHCQPIGNIVFEGTRIPKERLVGEPGEGFYICMRQLNNTRITAAAAALGIMEGCLEIVRKHVNERVQFGRKIKSFQMIQASLADMETSLEAARLLTYQAAWLKDNGYPNQKQISIAKYFATEAAVKVANEAMTILGACGYMGDYHVERYLRDGKSLQIVEGTSNIHKSIIAGISVGELPIR